MRILLSTESSALNTGYGTMTLEIARRLHAAGHEVAELASYVSVGDQRIQGTPWRVYPVIPHADDKQNLERYGADPYNQFGKFAFEEACLHFRPEAIVAIRDPWMEEHVARSPLRPFYRFLYLPTVDAAPQKNDWLDTFASADFVCTYTDWAHDLLKEQAGDRLNLCGSTPPGVDANTFAPIGNKAELRAAFGIPADALIVGFVSRNQQRKRFPEFAEAFRHWLDTAPPELAARTYLYWHTSWPDVGWDLPSIIKEAGIASRTFFTYKCRGQGCQATFASRWMDARNACVRCGQPSATLPNTNVGLAREEMAYVNNLFDVYVQFSNSEGLGIGLVEAAACGVPVMGTDYSGMADVVRKLTGTPIAVKSFYREPETGCQRAIPDKEDFARKLTHILSMPETLRRYRGGQARTAACRHYDWDKTVSRWVELLQGAPPAQSWDSPRRFHIPAQSVPANLTNSEFVRWGFHAVAGRPDLAESHVAQKMLRDLNWGATLTGHNNHFSDESFIGRARNFHEVTREGLCNVWLALSNEFQHWESRRAEMCR